jgi:hypothetical protein
MSDKQLDKNDVLLMQMTYFVAWPDPFLLKFMQIETMRIYFNSSFYLNKYKTKEMLTICIPMVTLV